MLFTSRVRRAIVIAVSAVLLCAAAFAENITGTVTNGTNKTPAANADVILISLMQGMQESARTKTNASGKYSIAVPDKGPHLIRVAFHDVNYHKVAPPGTTTADVTVYDSAKKVEGLRVNVETAYQTDAGKLQAVQFYTVRNESNPPRTQGGDQSFMITLPEGAEIDQARAQLAGGQPVEQSPTPTGKKDEYAFSFPVRPGESMFQIGYHLPYSGEMTVTPKIAYPVNQFALVLPQSIKFESKNASIWEAPQHQGGISLRIASNTEGKDLSYRISGTGTLPDQQADAQAGGGGAQPDNAPRPGGGIGAPIDAPDPLSRYRWPLLSMLGGLLALGALFMVSRRNAPMPTPAQTRSALLNELKEQLFELELDRKQGRISPDDYEKNKAALDATMERALAKKSGQ
jgi:Carboxypeptidase regulatory-like domain